MLSGDVARAIGFYAVALCMALALAVLCTPLLGDSTAMVTMLTPAAAAVIMLAITGEARSPADWKSLGVARGGVSGWPPALLGPVGILGTSYGLLIALGLASLTVPEAD